MPSIRTHTAQPSESTPPPENRSDKKQQTTIPALWKNEPPLRDPIPSFQDHGLERHGVLEKMAPLGSLPPHKYSKLKITIGGANKRKSGGKVLSSVASPAVATPEVTPPAEQPESDEQPPTKRARTEEKSVDLNRVINGAALVDEETPAPSPVPVLRIATPQSAMSRRLSSPLKMSASSSMKRIPFTRAEPGMLRAYEEVLENAIKNAEEAGNAKLGEYITHFFHESYHDWDLASALDGILFQRASEDEQKAFKDGLLSSRASVHRQNREYRAQKRHERQLEKEERQTRPNRKQSPTTPISPTTPLTKPSTPKLKSPAVVKERPAAQPSRMSSRKSSLANGTLAPSAEINGTRTRSTRQTRTSLALAQPVELVEPAPPSPLIQTPPNPSTRETRSKKRVRADSSTSDLSSVDEELVEKGPPGSLGVGTKRNAQEVELNLVDEEAAAKRRELDNELDERRSKFNVSGMSFLRKNAQQPRSGIVLSFNSGRSTRSNAQRRAREGSDAMMLETPQPSPKIQGLAANLRSSRSLGPPDRQPKKHTGARTKIS
jgi:hypothetical protein